MFSLIATYTITVFAVATRNRVLVTGSSGFIGTNLVDLLLVHGYEVLASDVLLPKNNEHLPYFQQIDLLDQRTVEGAIKTFAPDSIFHLGARTDLDGASVDEYRVNYDGTRFVLNAANATPSVKHVIVASTRLVNRIGYQPLHEADYCPTTHYGESKVLTEKVVRELASNQYASCIVRPTSIWGPWFGIPYRTFFDNVLDGRYVHPMGRRILKSFGFVGNTTFQLHKLIKSDLHAINKQTFYLADYMPIEVFELSQEIAKQAGKGRPREVPSGVLKVAALAGDGLKSLGWKNPPLTSFRLDNLMTEMIYDTNNLEEITGDLPFTLEAGVKETLAWMGRAR